MSVVVLLISFVWFTMTFNILNHFFFTTDTNYIIAKAEKSPPESSASSWDSTPKFRNLTISNLEVRRDFREFSTRKWRVPEPGYIGTNIYIGTNLFIIEMSTTVITDFWSTSTLYANKLLRFEMPSMCNACISA